MTNYLESAKNRNWVGFQCKLNFEEAKFEEDIRDCVNQTRTFKSSISIIPIMGRRLPLYLGWLVTNLFFGGIFPKKLIHCACHTKNLNEALKHHSFII
jgi:hypothetical protein